MAIDYFNTAEKTRERLQRIGKRCDLLGYEGSSSGEPWEAIKRYVPGGVIYGLVLPVDGTGLGWGITNTELLDKASIKLMFVCADSLKNPRDFAGILMDGKEYRILRIEALRPKDATILYYGWLGE